MGNCCSRSTDGSNDRGDEHASPADVAIGTRDTSTKSMLKRCFGCRVFRCGVRTLKGHSGYVCCGVHYCSTFVMMCLCRRSIALRCLRTVGASCLGRRTARSRCGTWRPANAWRRWKGTRTKSMALRCFRTGGASCLGRSTIRSSCSRARPVVPKETPERRRRLTYRHP